MMDGKLRNMTSLYLTDDAGVLCLYRIGSRVANKLYVGSAGGHFEKDELNNAKTCVLREMEEELGLKEADLEGLKLRYITLRLKNGEIRQNYYFFARLRQPKKLASSEGQLRWVSWETLRDLSMPVSAKHMILHYRDVGRFDECLYAGITRKDTTDFVALEEFED